MELSENLLCLFTTNAQKQDDSYVIEVPEREVAVGAVEEGETYRVAILSSQSTTEPTPHQERSPSEPPVTEGDLVDVETETIGDQGDGIARVGPGYVVIVSDTDVGERVAVEITETRENVAFAEVIERYDR